MPSGVYTRTEEGNKNMSLSKIGKKHSEEWKKKMSLALTGRKHSEEWNKNISIGNTGRKASEETRRKLSESHKGQYVSPERRRIASLTHLGRKRSKETREKMSAALKGKKPWNWKGGATPINKLIYYSYRYQQWRQDIFVRDNFTCQECKQHGGKLHAHHKNKTFSQLLQEIRDNLPLFSLYDGAMIYAPLWDVNNGVTLCKKCHDKKHTKTKEIIK